MSSRNVQVHKAGIARPPDPRAPWDRWRIELVVDVSGRSAADALTWVEEALTEEEREQQ
jgi:hypothetical protein